MPFIFFFYRHRLHFQPPSIFVTRSTLRCLPLFLFSLHFTLLFYCYSFHFRSPPSFTLQSSLYGALYLFLSAQTPLSAAFYFVTRSTLRCLPLFLFSLHFTLLFYCYSFHFRPPPSFIITIFILRCPLSFIGTDSTLSRLLFLLHAPLYAAFLFFCSVSTLPWSFIATVSIFRPPLSFIITISTLRCLPLLSLHSPLYAAFLFYRYTLHFPLPCRLTESGSRFSIKNISANSKPKLERLER